MSILFHEIQRDHACVWRGQRWMKAGLHYVIPEGCEDTPENRQFVPSHDAVELVAEPTVPHVEPAIHDGENN